MQSICKHLLFEASNGTRKLDLIKFVWIERDPVVVESSDIYDQSEKNKRMCSQIVDSAAKDNSSDLDSRLIDIATEMLLSIPPLLETEEAFEMSYSAADSELDTVSGIFDDERMSSRMTENVEIGRQTSDNVLDAQFYITGERETNLSAKCLRKGRPDIIMLFQEMRHHAIESGEKRVAVFVCAPFKLTKLCQKAAVVFSDSKLRFDVHTESLRF
jgi:Ferric reductase NAD binding domain